MKVRLLVRRRLVRGSGSISIKRGSVRAAISRASFTRSIMGRVLLASKYDAMLVDSPNSA